MKAKRCQNSMLGNGDMKFCQNPTQISTLFGLRAAANGRRSVVVPNGHCLRGPLPAAFVLNMTGAVIVRMFDMGMVVYEKVPDDCPRPVVEEGAPTCK